MIDRVWIVCQHTDYEDTEIKGVYSTPHLARAAAIRMLLAEHGIDQPPPIQVDDLKLGHFSWRVYDNFTWTSISHEVISA